MEILLTKDLLPTKREISCEAVNDQGCFQLEVCRESCLIDWGSAFMGGGVFHQ